MGSLSWEFTTGAPLGAGPYSSWGSSSAPAVDTDSDSSASELGIKLSTDVAGTINSVRFYKGPDNTGTHIGDLWTSTGTFLATATFTGETAAGWHQVNFSTPVSIQPNTTYVAAYHTNVGHYAQDDNLL